MQDIRDFLKDAYNELLKIYRIVQESPFIRTVIRNITDRSNINVALESLILCLIYSINVILNFDDPTFQLTFIENVVLLLSYFSAYYFAPKRNFEFKTLALYLLAVVIASPVIIYSHSAQEIAKTYEFMLLASCIIGLVFRADVDESKKIPAMLVLERSLSQEQLDTLCAHYQIVAIVTEDSSLSDQYRVFATLKQATDWLNFIKLVPIFSFPLHLIYMHSSEVDKAVEVLDFANEFGLYAVNANLRPIELAEFAAKRQAQQTLESKKVLIEYDGNVVIKTLIDQLSKTCRVVVACQYPQYISSGNSSVIFRFAPLEAILEESGREFDIVFSLSRSNPKFFTEENLNYAIGYNVMKYASVISACRDKAVKTLFLISNCNAMAANTWSGASQRLAELYAQSTATEGKVTRIVPVRIPNTLLEVESNPICDASDICDNLIKFISNLEPPSNKIYSIIIPKYINLKNARKLFCRIQGERCEPVESIFPSLNEVMSQTNIENVYSTEFSKDQKCNLEEVRKIMHSRSVIELTERVLRLLKRS